MKAYQFVLIFILAVLGSGIPVLALEGIATVRTLKGEVMIEHSNGTKRAVPGATIMKTDILTTGPGSAVGIIFKDNSVLSMGPESRIVFTRFEFDPVSDRLGLAAKIIKGTMTYLSGVIGHLKPESVRFATPSAVIGIRGTHLAIAVEE